MNKNWDNDALDYSEMDATPQTFFYSLVSFLKIGKSKNILEIGCGAGLLLPYVIDRKLQGTPYVASDLSQAMITKSEERLRKNY